MAKKWTVEDIEVGSVMETTFKLNSEKGSKFRFKAGSLDGKRAPKVVLCNDTRISPGVPCLVRITAVDKPERQDHGKIEVEFVRHLDFKIDGVYVDPVVSKKLQVLLESGLNILLDGPQGCGKTVLAKAIAETLGMEFVFFNCSAVIEPTDFLATMLARQAESGGAVTDFIETDLLRGLVAAKKSVEDPKEPYRRFLVFLDELNRCHEHARNMLMPALDQTRRIFNPITGEFLEIPNNVQFIAAVNQGSEFSGTFGIDAAQLDRFAPLQMSYMPVEAEIDLLAGRHPTLTKSLIADIVGIADEIRKSSDFDRGLSVRATEEACVYLEHPLMESNRRSMLQEVLKSSFCGRFRGTWDDTTTDAGAVWGVIQRVLRERKSK